MQNMPTDRMRDLVAERMISEAQSSQNFTITCMAQQPGGMSVGGPNPTEDRARPELFRMSKDFFNHDPAPVPANYPFRAFTAAVIWHEVMHERGYHHPNTDVPREPYNASLAPIVGACMDQSFYLHERECGFAPCPGGMMMLPETGGDVGSCICVPNSEMKLVDRWDWPGLDDIGVNSAGDGYALAWAGQTRTAFKREGHAWSSLGAATKIVAGGDSVALRQSGTGTKPIQYWNIIPRVGPNETAVITSGDAGSAAIDGFGTFYRTTALGRIERHRPNIVAWQDLGAGSSVTAGSDLAYFLSNGQLDRFNAATGIRTGLTPISNTSSTVDAYGSYYSLAGDGTIVRWRGTYFELIGWQDTAVGAGDNFYTRSTNGWVYRLNPESGWQAIAVCDRFSAGGRNLFCRRGNTLELYGY